MENNSINEIAGMKVYNSAEELSAAMNSEPQQEEQSIPQDQVQSYEQPEEGEPQGYESNEQPQYSNEEVESAVIEFLSERLGRDISSFDELQQNQYEIDERVDSIARFVNETGRSPEDWFAYQTLDTSEMDDLTAIRIHMASEYPSLSQDELNVFIQNRYKLDPDLNSEEEVRLSQVQLKVDANNAKRDIEAIREAFRAPERQDVQYESFIDDNWIDQMSSEVDTLEGLEFDLGDGNSFTFSINDNYRNELKDINSNLDTYFDDYIRDDGSWDFDMLSSHRAVIDNIDSIVAEAYKQGLSNGQKNIVNRAANVQAQTPNETGQQANPLADQLRNILGGQSNKLTFKV